MTHSINDFNKIILPIVKSSSRKRCHDYYSAILNAHKADGVDENHSSIMTLFQNLFSYHVRPDSPGETFGPLMVMGDKRTAIPSDLTREEREYLAELLPTVTDPEARSRIADTLWELKHGKAQSYAVEAIKAYLESAHELDDENFTFATELYARALRIYASIKRSDKDNKLGSLVTKEIIKATDEAVKTGPPYLLQGLVNLVRNARLPEAKNYIPAITELAEKFEADNNFNAAHDAWLLVSRLHHDQKELTKVSDAAMRAAETYVKMADMSEVGPSPSYMHICSWLNSAVASYREINGGKERAKELYQRMIKLQPKIHDEMQKHTIELNIQEPVENAIAHVAGKTTIGAILRLALYRRPTSIAELKKSLADQMKNAPLLSTIGGTYHNKKGHVVARKELDESEEDKLHRVASEIRSLQPMLFIEPALTQIRLEHTISLQEWIDFLHSHPFVPPEHRVTYAKGLYHGFHGDYAAAAHILVPQVENSIRYILEQNGEETSKLNTQGLQEESTLTTLLNNPKLVQIIGDNVVFDLKGLLDEKVGDNFRHLLSHGLLDDNALDSALPVYFYWLVLNLIFGFLSTEGLDLGPKDEKQ
jgi:tetratricopeptide (TPR) repeat protein